MMEILPFYSKIVEEGETYRIRLSDHIVGEDLTYEYDVTYLVNGSINATINEEPEFIYITETTPLQSYLT